MEGNEQTRCYYCDFDTRRILISLFASRHDRRLPEVMKSSSVSMERKIERSSGLAF